MRLGILGGTFDPPHLGHLQIVELVKDEGGVDVVLLVPCLRHRLGKTPVAFEHRVRMCELMIEDVPGAEVSRMEERMEHPGRTLELVTLLSRQRPGAKLRLIAGADIYHERHRWYRFDEVTRLAEPIYLARVGAEPLPLPTLPAPVGLSSSVVRERLRAGEDASGMLHPAVLDYVRREGLYRGGER